VGLLVETETHRSADVTASCWLALLLLLLPALTRRRR
jgi:MYXO-CTERM domain-containing protein